MKIVVAIPALNEEPVLRDSITTLQRFLSEKLPQHEFLTVIVDNGSDDGTGDVGAALAAEYPGVRYMRLDRRGKGLAIRTGWDQSDGDAFIFMDADLSTDLAALPELIAAIEDGADVAVGSRYHRDSTVRRSLGRKALSKGYHLVLRTMFGTAVADVPCGFKAACVKVVREIVPKIKDDRWFFDTELVIRSEKAGYTVKEVPVDWKDYRPEGTRSKVVVGRLITEYLAQSTRLWRELRNETSRKEWRWVFGIAALVMAVTSIPPLFGLWFARTHGLEWKGTQFLSPGDTAFYLSYIEQAKEGRWLFQNMFTTEQMMPVLNILWLPIGIAARLFALTPIAAYHSARLALIPLLAAAAYLFIARVYADSTRRSWAYGLFMLASGWGMYYSIGFGPGKGALSYEWPVDLWVAESNAFMSMLYSPHFIASFALIILSFHLLLRAFETRRTLYAAFSGLAAMVLFQFHPFHVPVLYAVPAIFLFASAFQKKLRRDMIVSYLFFLVISFPSVLYQLSVLGDPLWRAISAANRTPTPSLLHVLLGFGLLSFLWFFGYRKEAGSLRADFLAAWIVVQGLLIYAPVPFQRRMLEGLEFPLAVLAVPALLAAYRWYSSKMRNDRPFIIVSATFIVCVLFLPSTVSTLVRSVDVYAKNDPPLFYWTTDESTALDWLEENTPADSSVLSAADTGNGIVGWASRRVYAGHWAGTPFIGSKIADIAFFYGPSDSMDRIAFLLANEIDYVYWGRSERKYGGDPGQSAFLNEVFSKGEIVIFEVLK